MNNAAITLTGVTKTFPGKHGRVEAVRGVDLEIAPGEVVAFLGPNGAGKTTTIDMILGLSEPTTGNVTVFGMTPHAAVARGLVAAVMQTGGLLKDLTVRESVEYVAALFPDARPVDDVLATAGITDLADRRLGKCSGGEQQRVRFAMALVPDPALIVLDEPTTGMDVNARRAFWEAIHADAARGRTILFATHYLEEADAWADRVVVMRDGEIVADGSSSDIRAAGGGRRVSATWPDADIALVEAIEGVSGVDVHGDQIVVHTSDSDAVARELLTRTTAHSLDITSRGIEDAFVELTSPSEAGATVSR
ncbi:ABC transporter ATP-binding protein [Dermacoccus nishinomiyaensis]|uniref:ABC transporter ATP-binding protein n=1 Tax=Dermacoccus TaxID=57495 RepID=UPI00104D87BF|nr:MULTISPECIES: ABC transporter ATP-binding protein [Dermacoccus]MBO1757017.1 ABC transporter ATP-binding protein [Dermacoccus sp. NHGro5]TCJ92675.1 ABC-2 type transport system ATP-binding protein [Dermacoccus sp. SAI-028]TJZ96616.1 ABC transporter ATP-binding protein [Dermacoccus nishinomiyaensis]